MNVIQNRLEKYIAFTINNRRCFLNRMQFINSSLDELVKNFTNNDFKYLSQKFSDGLSELVLK